MRVSPTYWGPPSCEGLLCSCSIDVVQESNPYIYMCVCVCVWLKLDMNKAYDMVE